MARHTAYRQHCGFTIDEYELLYEILGRDYGVDLERTGLASLQTKIAGYRERHGLASVADCMQHLRTHSPEIHDLGDVVYSRRTWFNRSPEHFQFLVSVARDWMSRTMSTKGLEIWSAACSTGQEAYTIAIYLLEYVFTTPSSCNQFHVTASDCSQASLGQAMRGVYATEDIAQLQPIPYEKYFTPGEPGRAAVNSHVRERVSLTYFNLITSEYAFAPKPSIVFLRNAIDFHVPRSRADIFKKIHDNLQDGGYLVLGDCPSLNAEDLRQCRYESVAPGCYRATN